MLDAALTAAEMVEKHLAHDAPAQARPPAQCGIHISDADDAVGDEMVDLARQRGLQAVRDILEADEGSNLEADSHNACCRLRRAGNRAEGDDTDQHQHTLLGLYVAVGLLWLTANSIELILKLQSRTRWVRRVLHLNRP